jgi:hypothetical protein
VVITLLWSRGRLGLSGVGGFYIASSRFYILKTGFYFVSFRFYIEMPVAKITTKVLNKLPKSGMAWWLHLLRIKNQEQN